MVGFIFASYLDEVLVRNYTMGGFKKGKIAGTTMVSAYCKSLKSLTPKSVRAGMKNSRSEGFLLTKHKHTNILTMMEPYPPPAPWF
jgi:hypothetical protein